VNLASLFASLVATSDLPLHFLKVVEFETVGQNKPMLLFLQLLFEQVLEKCEDGDKLQMVFAKGMKD